MALIAHWKFDGDVTDSVGSYDATNSGASLTTGVTGVADTAYYFDGSTDYMTIPSTTTLGIHNSSFTISLWVSPDNLTGEQYIITSREGGTGYTMFFLRFDGVDNDIDASIGTLAGTGYIDITDVGGGDINVGSWNHIVFSYDRAGKSAALYLNGSSIGTDSHSETEPTLADKDITLCDIGGGDSKLEGKIDDIRIYNTALASSDVTVLYHSFDVEPNNWDTTNHRLIGIADSSPSSSPIYYDPDGDDVTQARMSFDLTGVAPTALQLSATDGNHWETVTRGQWHTFTNTGISLKWKMLFGSNAASSDYIENLKIEYKFT